MHEEDIPWFEGIAAALFIFMLITYPLWRVKPEADTPASETSASESSREGGSGGSSGEGAWEGAGSKESHIPPDVTRQLERYARRERRGYYQRKEDNPHIPESVRERYAAERQRLEALAREYPEIMAKAEANLPAPSILPDGSFSPEFQDLTRMLKLYGKTDELMDAHVDDLMQDAEDDDLPASMRPSPEEIRRVREQGILPMN